MSAVLAEAARDKKLAESPCTGIQLPGVVAATDFILPAHAQIEALAVGLPPDWGATVWLMHGFGLRIGEALAVSLRCRINRGQDPAHQGAGQPICAADAAEIPRGRGLPSSAEPSGPVMSG